MTSFMRGNATSAALYLRAVLVEIRQHTGLRFRVLDQLYVGVKAPFFYSLVAGYQDMAASFCAKAL
ncbi:hypothetical protein [Pseudomonas sp. R4-35-07]|uniref:hypothetical protein n=1 Tax=Pseudomonas sp. R4-35-07 TaxID=658643 RepID=UPI000F57FC6A|nr:hypothetical protein [Pseudomonas sp. R4-35-07]